MLSALVLADPLEAAFEVLKPGLRAPSESERIVAGKCIGLMVGYHERWKQFPYRVDYVERVVESDLFNPDTQRTSRSFRLGGKLDVGVTEIEGGRRVVIDHKTTSDDISDPNGAYWRQLVIEGQVTQYMLLEFLNGRKIDYALWDVVRKPGIAPKQIAKKDRDSILQTREYFGNPVEGDNLDEFIATDRETPLMYSARLAHDCAIERPLRYFARRQVPRLDAELLEYAREVWGHSQDLLQDRRNSRHPRNSGACMRYGSPCKYLGICSGHDSIDSDKWTRRTWVHPELPTISGEGDGRDLLTNSRIRTYQTCKQLHYLQYELGLERIDEEEREALFFGTTFHEAMEQYFLTLKSQQESN